MVGGEQFGSEGAGPGGASLAVPVPYEAYLAWAHEDVHAEWVGGEVIVAMPPKEWHQRLVTFVATLLNDFVRFFDLGWVLVAPFEMKLGGEEGPARQPDVLFLSRDHAERLTQDRLVGPADLVVEFVSDESVRVDRADKFYEYQVAGVAEYWVVDPRPGRERADFWVLDAGGRYRPMPPGEDGIYRSSVLPGFWLRLDWLWAEAPPDPLTACAEIIGLPGDVLAVLRQIKARGPAHPCDG